MSIDDATPPPPPPVVEPAAKPIMAGAVSIVSASDTAPATPMPSIPTSNPKPAPKLDLGVVADRIYALAGLSGHPMSKSIARSLETIEESLARYGSSLAISFNGGKDCTVLLHLYAAALYRHLSLEQATKDPIIPPMKAIYVTYPAPFDAVEDFVEDSVVRYGLDLVRLSGPMKGALQAYLDLTFARGDKVEAILVGQRRADPFSEHLRAFHPTDTTWPTFMRVHPIIDWSYHDIWRFLLEPSLTCCSAAIGVPYCVLYGWGYTSLGSSHNTHPNPDLCREKGEDGFDPAWKLKDEDRERCGREVSSSSSQSPQPQQQQKDGDKVKSG